MQLFTLPQPNQSRFFGSSKPLPYQEKLKPQFGRIATTSQTLSDAFKGTKSVNQPLDPSRLPALTYKKVETRHDPVIGDIHHYRFSNGLSFIGIQKKDVPLVSYGDLYYTGSGIEHDWNDGAAHILEHMIFKGTKDFKSADHTREYSKRLEDLGAHDNAMTARDYTFYFIQNIPSKSLPKVIKIQSSVLQRPLIDAKELEKEKGAILEEFNRFYNQKMMTVLDHLYGAVWPDHTYGRKHFGLGPKENIKALTREELLDFYGKHYGHENHTVIAVGDFNLDDTLKQIAARYNKPFPPTQEEYPKNLGKADYSNREAPFKPSHSPSLHNIHDKDMTVAIHAQGFEGPRPQQPKSHREIIALDMLSSILAGGESSRLYQQLVEKDKLATSVSMGMNRRRERSAIFLDAQVEPKNLDKVRNIIREHLNKAQQELVTQKELDKTITQNETALAGKTESTFGLLFSLAGGLGSNNLDHMYSKGLNTVRSITREEIRDAARKYLTPEKMKEVNLLPPKALKFGQRVDSQPSSVKFSGKLGPLDQSHFLKDGTELIVRHKPGALRTAFSIQIKGGNAADPEGLSGLSDYMADLIMRGTKTLSATDLQHKLENKSLSLGISSGEKTTTIYMAGLTKFKDEMINILSDVLSNPAFEQKELDFNRKQLKESYQASLDMSPKAVLNQILSETRYPDGHPYGITTNRLLKNANRFTPDNIREAHQQQFQRPNLTIAVSGGLFKAEAAQASERIVENLPKSSIPVKPIIDIPIQQSKTVTAARENIQQIELNRLWDAPSLFHADQPVVTMLNAVLSLGSSSRIFKRFREDEHSLAYDARTSYTPSLHGGDFKFYVGTDPKNTTKVQTVLQEEIDKIIKHPPKQEELDRVRKIYQGIFLSRQESNDAISSNLSAHRALGTDSLDELLEKLDQVTPAQIQTAAKKYLTKPSITAIVAPKAVIKKHGLPDPVELDKPKARL